MLIQSDARSLPLVTACVQCVVTSPPYFGLRDYGIDRQIGLEPTPEAYVSSLVEVFREVRRVLKDDGIVWLNLGDSYNSSSQHNHGKGGALAHRHLAPVDGWAGHRPNIDGLKTKDLLGIPWRVAFALQADGWYLRSDIIWAKPNPMPESVTDRPTKAHEYLFLLSKCERYQYDAEAIKEGDHVLTRKGTKGGHHLTKMPGYKGIAGGTLKRDPDEAYGFARDVTTVGRNKRSVWTIPTMPYQGAHFATMPEALVEPCILAGSRVGDHVLDPFSGSGTVGAVAERLGRRWVGVDLNPAYHVLASVRTRQRGLRWDV